MKHLIIALLLTPTIAYAQLETSAYEKYSTDNNMTATTKLTWEIVDDVEKTCNDISISKTGSPFPYKVDACSKWSKRSSVYECHIITGKNVNNDIIGHEIRHCYQGNFHF